MDNLFFVLSKLIWGFFSPTSLMVWLLVLVSLLLWLNYIKAARRLMTMMSLLALLVMAYPVSDWLMYPLETRFQAPEKLPDNIDAIIVLGGAENLRLSASWKAPQVGESAERVLAAAELSRYYPDVPLIYTGGSNLVQMPNLDETGTVSKHLLTQAGVDPTRIMIESRARNTFENFKLIKTMLPEAEGTYLLVTSAFHMPRSVGIARQQSINVIAYPVDYRSAEAEQRYWDFDLSGHLDVLEVAWHEWLGLTAYFATGKTAEWLPRQRRSELTDMEL